MSRFALIAVAAAVACAAACDVSADPRLGAVSTGPGQTGSSLSLTPSTAQMNVGGVLQMQTNAPLDLRGQLQWSSSQPAIAAVTPTGVVQGLGPGTTVISVRYSFDTTAVSNAVITVNTVAGSGTRIP